jgi:hypothetical protein
MTISYPIAKLNYLTLTICKITKNSFYIFPVLSDFILHAVVAAGHARGRSALGTILACVFHHLMGLRKLRNLKVAATKSLNLGIYKSAISVL